MAASTVPASDENDVEAVTRQFVTFGVAGETFAVPLAHVNEIIRYPDVVRAPLGPPALVGLANLRGTVLPILSLRCMLATPDVDHDDTTRVVVLDDAGLPVGLVVDRMYNVITVEPERIESADTIRSTIVTDALTGVIKNTDNGSMVMILDASLLIERQFDGARGAPNDAGVTTTAVHAEQTRERLEAHADIQLVSFAVADQEYALPIESVQEIVQIPERVTVLPNAAAHVLGVMTLRDRLLPLVSLRRMLGLPAAELSEANKIIVVSPLPGLAVGMVSDSVREVLRVNRTLIDPVPEMLAQAHNVRDITSICRLAGGNRLVSILCAGQLFDVDELRGLSEVTPIDEAVGADADDAVEMETESAVDDEEQLVVFRVMNEDYGVPIAAVQEIVPVPDELTRVPTTPDFIEGVVNLRGAVLPVVDQRRRFGLAAAERNERQRIVVYAIGGIRTGFIVDSVSRVLRVPLHLIGPAPRLSIEQSRMIRRVVNFTDHEQMIMLLEVDQLLNLGEIDDIASTAAA